MGEKVIDDLINLIGDIESQIGYEYAKWSWLDFLLFCSQKVKSNVLKAIIEIGALSHTGLSRTQMLFEYDALSKLTVKEINYIQQYHTARTELKYLLMDIVDLGVGRDKGIANKNRLRIINDIITTLNNPPYVLQDSANWISGVEESLIGTPITCTKIDDKDTNAANANCKEFNNKKLDYYIIAVQIDNVNEIKTKKGKNPGQSMAFLSVNDTSGSVDSTVVFPNTWEEYKGLLISGNTVLLGGVKGKDNALIVNKVWQI